MAIVGPDYRFICVDIGGYGKNSDGGIFDSSNMGQRFEAGLMNIPKDKLLPGQIESCSHVLIGDEAFALKPYLMRPFPYRQSRLNTRKENYNNRLCKAGMSNMRPFASTPAARTKDTVIWSFNGQNCSFYYLNFFLLLNYITLYS